MRREQVIERALRMTQVQKQRKRNEHHEAQRGEQSEMRDRLQPLKTEYLIQARNRERAGNEPGEIGIDDNRYGPLDNRLVGIDPPGVGGVMNESFH